MFSLNLQMFKAARHLIPLQISVSASLPMASELRHVTACTISISKSVNYKKQAQIPWLLGFSIEPHLLILN